MRLDLNNILQILILVGAAVILFQLLRGNSDLRKASKELEVLVDELGTTKLTIDSAKQSLTQLRDTINAAKLNLQDLRNEVKIELLEDELKKKLAAEKRKSLTTELEQLRTYRCKTFKICQ